MSTDACEQWREALAMYALGDVSAEEIVALEAHLEGCAGCRAELEELQRTVSLLALVDPTTIATPSDIPAVVSESVLGALAMNGARERRRTRVRWISGVGTGAVAAAVVLVAFLSGSSTPPPAQRTVALHGLSSVSASAQLVAQSWGTTVHLRERGLPSGTLYTVSMESTTGKWWVAGTYRSTPGTTVNATMTCGVALNKIRDIRVENGSGVTVLSNYHPTKDEIAE